MTIICTEEQKKEIINAQFCPTIKCQRYSKEYGAQYETCEQCREDTIEWIIERPQGEWIYERPNGKTYSDFVYCSECQKPNGFYITNFCPNCGADMRKGEKHGSD